MTTPNLVPQPLQAQHTGDSVKSHSSAGQHQDRILSRRSSVVNAQIDTQTIGTPAPHPARPRMHKRSLTGNYYPNGDDPTETTWPIGDEKTWKDALAADEEKDVDSVARHVVHHVSTTLARQAFNLDDAGAYRACAFAVRDELIRRWNETTSYHTAKAPKRAYYLSLEFLMGRSLDNAVLNLNMKDMVAQAMGRLGFSFEDLIDEERDAGLGNGGLGRLAACYMDSSATLNLPVFGYGLRYDYGIFKQLIDENGRQLEAPDSWLADGNPFEIERPDVQYHVRFFGNVEWNEGKAYWWGGQEVVAKAYDVPIPGWKTKNINNLRLWSATPIGGFDLQSFNAGDYEKAVAASSSAETITRVLYPNDNTYQGKELRLKQQYFWCSASLQDILRRFKKLDLPFTSLPDYVAIQLNDTHPTVAMPELQRILVDEEGMEFGQAWEIVCKVFSYTNHTVLPEALETWPVPLFQSLLPRHLSIIYDVNSRFLQEVSRRFPGDRERIRRMSLIEESEPKRVRMALLACMSHKVNGVAELHSGLVKSVLFKDQVEFYGPDKFMNVTNGITPRRFVHQANPELSNLITQCIGTEEWLTDLSLLKNFEPFAQNPQVRKSFQAIKERNKLRLAEIVENELGTILDPTAMFTVQAKRIHEYKRQSLNILGCIHRYLRIKKASKAERRNICPHVAFFAGKSAPGYYIAKTMIQLINNVARVVNDDPEVGDLFKIVFIPDYSVSIAELLMPAADVSVQISTAGTEASGTGNMKLAVSGALLLGTVDGANVEIAEEAGEEQCFLFGHLAEDVDEVRYQNQYNPTPIEQGSQACADAIQAVRSGMFGNGDYNPFLDTITQHGDYWLVSNDFDSYLEAERLCDEMFMKNHPEWIVKSMLTTARMGKFSSDRAVAQYAEEIWNIEPEPVPVKKE
ncbi:Non-essential glycogen phosphorylase [Naganishia albida]|nr:Non-essential glycogen phosphorylase [Naganishia albida]